MAISIGNVHLQQDAGQGLDLDRLREIEGLTSVPLVIHGGSGVPIAQRAALAATSQICKFNIGTELRMVFGSALREAVARDPDRFDRIEILRDTEAAMTSAARAVIRNLGAHGQAGAAG
jgi:fructose-bisphosphate aldolase class II